MANTTNNQEFNKAIKQLQSLVEEKGIINLAEKFYNLKVEMSSLTRAIKEKENALILAEAKAMAEKPAPKVEVKAEEKPAVVFDEEMTLEMPILKTETIDFLNKTETIVIKDKAIIKTEMLKIQDNHLIQIIEMHKLTDQCKMVKDHSILTLSLVKNQ